MRFLSQSKLLVCLAVLTILSLNLKSYALTSSIYEFEIVNNNQAKIIGCNDFNGGHMSIPTTISYDGIEYQVVEIGNYALSSRNISSIDIPEGLTTIDEGALAYNSLKEVVLPQSLTLLSCRAFVGNDLTQINIPPLVSLQDGSSAFESAGGADNTIDTVIIDHAETPWKFYLQVKCGTLIVKREWIGSCYGVSDKLLAEGDDLIINSNMFENFNVFPNEISIDCRNVELTGSITDAPRKYGYQQYLNELATELVSVVNINCENIKLGNRAFSNLSKAEFNINVSGTMEVNGGTFYNCKSLKEFAPATLLAIKTGEFQNCTNLASITIPGDCQSVNSLSFLSCDQLKEIAIADSEMPLIVGVGTFEQTPIESLVLGRNVVSGDIPFYGLTTLKKLTLTSNITELPDYAFADCVALEEIYCESSTPPVIHTNTFKGVSTSNCKVYVKSNIGDYMAADGWKEFFASIDELTMDKSSIAINSIDGNIVITGIDGQKVAIFDINGKEIWTQAVKNNEVSANLKAGIYIILVGNKALKYNHNNF